MGLDYRSYKRLAAITLWRQTGKSSWKVVNLWPELQDLTWSIACNKSNKDKPEKYIWKPVEQIQFLPEVPIGDVAGVPLWTLSPNDWEAAGGRGWGGAPEGPWRGPGGVSLCGDVRGVLRGVLGCDVCPPASRASLLLRILDEYTSKFTYSIKVICTGWHIMSLHFIKAIYIYKMYDLWVTNDWCSKPRQSKKCSVINWFSIHRFRVTWSWISSTQLYRKDATQSTLRIKSDVATDRLNPSEELNNYSKSTAYSVESWPSS